MQNPLYGNEFRPQVYLHANQRFGTKTRFETEMQGTSEMVYFRLVVAV